MVENVDIAEKEKESKTFIKSAQNALGDRIEKIMSIARNPDKDRAKNEILKLEKEDKEANITQYISMYNISLQFIDGKIPEMGENGYKDLVQKFENDEVTKINKIADAIIEIAIENTGKYETLQELRNKYQNLSLEELEKRVNEVLNDKVDETENKKEDLPTGTVQEGIKNVNEATLAENEQKQEPVKPYELSRPTPDEIKTIYKYKVEGKISTGGKIPELDQFLGIIQPALNQLIIAPWKLTYGLLDAKDLALEKFKAWQTQRKNVNTALDTLKFMGIAPDDLELDGNNHSKQNMLAGYWNSYMTGELNTKLEAKKLDAIKELVDGGMEQREAETKVNRDPKYAPRKKFFDFSKEPDTAQEVLVDEFRRLLKADGVRGPDGKITEDGEKKIKGFCVMIDLFNQEDKDIIPTYYTNIISYMVKESKKRSKPGTSNIEDDLDIILKFKEDEEKNDYMESFAQFMSSRVKD
ncbi:MAG: hypothetical protein J6J27_00775 [Alphaproteobacteria bacterium]|nr:hypothetical protein [Alphaproteobacteria bacterium]